MGKVGVLRGLVGSVGIALVVAGMSPTGPASAQPVAPTENSELITERSDATTAAETARAQGHRVEDLSQRTESMQVFANPDGSWTSEQTSSPVRAKNRDGEWADIDLNLEKVDGGYAPANALGGLVVSDGGDKTFAELAVEGRDLGWQWPTALPEPRIEGNVATYPNVVEAGDLVVTATTSGFRHDVVLHRAPAAPVAFEIPVVTSGPKVSEDASGGLAVETKGGDELVIAAPAVMYDAVDPETGEPDRVASVDTTVTHTSTGSVITLDPDEAFLNDPSTRYPVTIDPVWSATNPDDTWIYNTSPTAIHPYDQTLYAGTPNGGATKYRSLISFNNGAEPWNGATVSSAILTLRNFNSSGTDCTGGAVQVRRVAQGWDPGSANWNNQPTTSTTYAVTNTARKGGSTGCSAGDVSWNVTGIAQEWAGWASNYGLRVAGFDETKTSTYREYRAAGTEQPPELSVTYNFPPSTPATPGVARSIGGPGYCGQWMASGNTTMPSLKATVVDPSSGDLVYGSFWTERFTSAGGGTWQTLATQNSVAATTPYAAQVTMLTSNAQVNGVFRDGLYRVRARAHDNYGGISAYSGTCSFYLDSKDPVLRMDTEVVDTYFGEPVAQDEDAWLPHNSQYALNLRLDSAGSEVVTDAGELHPTLTSDVEYYELESDVAAINGVVVDVELGATGDYSINLGASGLVGEHWVKVRAVDRAGRKSLPVERQFRVQGAVLTAQYDFEEGSGSTLSGSYVDGQSVAPVFTRSASGTSFVQQSAGAGDYYLHFDGSGVATATQPVVDSTRAFSVSAWVRADDVSTRRVVASQRAATGSAFTLAIENSAPGKARAVFSVTDSSGQTRTATSATELDPNKWYVLAGSFDDQSSPRRLQVWVADFVFPGHMSMAPNPAPDLPSNYAPAASVSTAIGAESIAGVWSNRWAGDIEDVRFYRDEVSDFDVAAHRNSDPLQ